MEITVEQIKETAVIGYLAWNAWTDLKKRQISIKALRGFAAIAVMAGCIWGSMSWALWGLIPGILLLALAGISHEAVGMGDALAAVVLGLYLGLWETVYVLLLALLLSALWAIVLLAVKKKGRGEEFPFLPFLLLGYVGRLILW